MRRFDNFDKAFKLLEEIVNEAAKQPLTRIEEEGMVQRFEYTWELAWKTMRDYLESGGMKISPVNALTVTREAIATRLVVDGQGWLDALNDRNLMSHTYDEKQFEEITQKIKNHYYGIVKDLHTFLRKQTNV